MGTKILGFLIIILSPAYACDRCLHQSKAAYFTSSSPLTVGACGYRSIALDFNGGYLAAATSDIYKGGEGCGACFQIRCKSTSICSKQGAKFIVTDLNKSNQTGFVLSESAFAAMGSKGHGEDVKKLGVVDVEYKRIPCEYKNKNLTVRVEEGSQKPYYLAIKILFQGGQTNIVDIDVAKVGETRWQFMKRNYGAVWDTDRVPAGALQFRFLVTGGYDGMMFWARSVVLPEDWKVGMVYDAGIQINAIAQEACSHCEGEW